jgi:hypothetical protein
MPERELLAYFERVLTDSATPVKTPAKPIKESNPALFNEIKSKLVARFRYLVINTKDVDEPKLQRG